MRCMEKAEFMTPGPIQLSIKILNISSAFMFLQNIALILPSKQPEIPRGSRVNLSEGSRAKPDNKHSHPGVLRVENVRRRALEHHPVQRKTLSSNEFSYRILCIYFKVFIYFLTEREHKHKLGERGRERGRSELPAEQGAR